jgi:hypothetical protein
VFKDLPKTEVSSDGLSPFHPWRMPADLPRETLAPSSKDPLLYFLSLLKDEQAKLSEAVTEVWSKQLAYLNASMTRCEEYF